MKYLLLVLMIVPVTFFSRAQTKTSPTFDKVNRLLARTEGKELDEEKSSEIKNQLFSYDSVVVNKSTLFEDISTVYTDIDWGSAKKLLIFTVNGSEKLLILRIELEKACQVKTISKRRVSEKVSVENTTGNLIRIYFLKKDKEAMTSLLQNRWE